MQAGYLLRYFKCSICSDQQQLTDASVDNQEEV